MDAIIPLAQILLFPGFLFLAVYGLLLQWVDRKLCAVMQNRMGPPWFQPLADFIKLLAKEVIVPDAAEGCMFRVLPYFAMAAVMTSMVMIPVGTAPLYGFQGDLIAVIYLLTIPTVTFFLAGWSSASPYSTVGSMRVLTQLFAYEVPLMLSLIGPAILAGTWNIAAIAAPSASCFQGRARSRSTCFAISSSRVRPPTPCSNGPMRCSRARCRSRCRNMSIPCRSSARRSGSVSRRS